jgi:hypothetical protein
MAISISGSSSQSLNAGANTSRVTAAGSMVLTVGNFRGLQSWGRVNIDGTPYNIPGPTSMNQGGSWGWSAFRDYGHNSAGQRGAVGSSVSHDIDGTTLHRGSTGAGTQPAVDYDRSANTPFLNEITRTSLTNFVVNYALTGSVNGPTTYVVQRSTNNWGANEVSFVNPGRFNNSVAANQEYYFRIYAFGDEGGNRFSGVYGPYWGQPLPPTNVVGTRSSLVAGRIDVSWTKPSNTQGGIQYYHVYRGATYIAQVNGENSVTYSDTGLTRGTVYTYRVFAFNGSYSSEVSNTSSATMAPGVPSVPGVPTVSSKVGRTVTINSTRGSMDYGNTISQYRIQLSTDNGVTWRGWDNTAKDFTASNTFNALDGSGNFTYQLLKPALTYRWRVYAVNSIGTGDIATMSTGVFVSSGGKRWDTETSSWKPTEVAKRWDLSLNGGNGGWADLTIAKRWDSAVNSGAGGWVDLT